MTEMTLVTVKAEGNRIYAAMEMGCRADKGSGRLGSGSGGWVVVAPSRPVLFRCIALCAECRVASSSPRQPTPL